MVFKQPMIVKISFIHWYTFVSNIDHVLLRSPVPDVKHKKYLPHIIRCLSLEISWPVPLCHEKKSKKFPFRFYLFILIRNVK